MLENTWYNSEKVQIFTCFPKEECVIVAKILLNGLLSGIRKLMSMWFQIWKTPEIRGKAEDNMIDYRYTELENDVKDIFECVNKEKFTTEGLETVYFYACNDEEPDMFYTVLAGAVYEAKNDVLTKDMTKLFLEYAERFDNGEFQPDMIPEDIPIVAKDIEFVRSKLNL